MAVRIRFSEQIAVISRGKKNRGGWWGVEHTDVLLGGNLFSFRTEQLLMH